MRQNLSSQWEVPTTWTVQKLQAGKGEPPIPAGTQQRVDKCVLAEVTPRDTEGIELNEMTHSTGRQSS